VSNLSRRNFIISWQTWVVDSA